MKPHALATVLVKLIGLSALLAAFYTMVSILGNLLLMGMEPFPYGPGWHRNVIAMTPHVIGQVAVGLWLLFKTRYVVQNLLKISPDE